MKQFFFFLLFHFTASSQTNNNISVVSVEKVNTVYRGITNLIKVGVPGAKSYTVTAPGKLEKLDSLGNYYWNVTAVTGRKAVIKIDITMPDGAVINEKKEFEIKQINPIEVAINDRVNNGCPFEMTKDEIISATINLKIEDFALNTPIEITALELYLPNEIVLVKGDILNQEAVTAIYQLKEGDKIIIGALTKYHAKITAAEVVVVK